MRESIIFRNGRHILVKAGTEKKIPKSIIISLNKEDFNILLTELNNDNDLVTESILRNLNNSETPVSDIDDVVFTSREEDREPKLNEMIIIGNPKIWGD